MVRQMLGASLLAAGACSHFHRGKSTAASPTTAAKAPAASAAKAPAAPATKAPATSAAKAPPAPTAAKARAATPPRAPNAPTDANITAIVLAEDNTDISYARLAQSRAQSPAVKEYAAQMLTEHSSVNRLVNELIVRINLQPQDNNTSLAFRDTSVAYRDQLRALQGRAFDSAYMASEVNYHSKLLSTLDTSLLPSARNADLRKLLTSLRPAVASHLEHAEQVRAGLGGQ
jgi:putative membrane protein